MAKRRAFHFADYFFAYADNSLGSFSFEDFKAILNFYLIFQDRLVIPDSFLINNDNLVKLFEAPDQGYAEALASGILVPAVRKNLTSLEELYEQFQQKGDARTSLPYIRTIDSLSKKHRITWDLKDVERQFTEGILHILDSPETLDPNFERLLHKGLKHDIVRLYEQNGALHRLDIVKLAQAKYLPLDEKTTRLFLGYVNARYQTNIPDLLEMEIAYPQLEQNLVQNRDLIKESRMHRHHGDYALEELYDRFDSLLFDTFRQRLYGQA